MASSPRRWSSPTASSHSAAASVHSLASSTTSSSSQHHHHHSSVTTLSTTKVFDLTSLYNERAGPRGDCSLFLRDLTAPSPPASTSSQASTPDYTHVANLYPGLQPQQSRGGQSDGSPYRYSPATASAATVTTTTMSLPQQQTQSLPVDAHMMGSLGPLSVDVRDSPTLSTTSVSSSRTDPEAEVDALTNLLLQGLDTVSRKKRPRSAQTPAAGNSNYSNNNNNVTNSDNDASPGIPNNINSPVDNTNGGVSSVEDSSLDSSTSGRVKVKQAGHECFRCRRAIPAGEHVHLSALRTRFHVACFACYACGIALATPVQPTSPNTSSSASAPANANSGGPPAAYFHAGDRLLCDRCVLTTVENCHACGRPIAERMLRALGHAYHPTCFACYACQKPLDGQPFTVDVHGRIHCIEDFHKRYAPRCHKCEEPIAPAPGENEARRVVTGGHSYHVSCFRRK